MCALCLTGSVHSQQSESISIYFKLDTSKRNENWYKEDTKAEMPHKETWSSFPI